MSKDAKDSSKPKPDGLRQPQRKDSLSSVLSWAGKITTSKPPTSSSSPSTPTPSPSTQHHHHHPPANGTRQRRHSHSTSSDSKTKTPMTPDPKASPGTSKAGKSSSSEKVNKAAAPDSQDGKQHSAPSRPQSAGDKPRSPLAPIPMPKSILRFSSPDGYRRHSQFGTPAAAAGEPTSPGLPPSPATPTFETVLSAPDSPPLTSSPTSPTQRPMSPVNRPMSPGTTVRFAKATVHRVEVGPGRRFLPVKRKSKSTLTYISPLDPGAQKSAPKTMLQSPTKLRRHQENQAAMGRYWLRTEEEEAQWRAEAERRAVEEAERYRNEPASPPPRPAVGAAAKVEGAVSRGREEIDKLPLLDGGGPAGLDKVEEETVAGSDDEDSDGEAGVRCDAEDDTASVTSKGSRRSINLRPSASIVALRAARAAAAATESGNNRPAEIKSFSERLAEKQAAEERRNRPGSPTIPAKSDAESSKSARSSTSSLVKEKPAAAAAAAAAATGAVSGRSSSTSTNSNPSGSNNVPSSTDEKLTRTPSREKEKEKDKARDRPRALTSSRSYMNLRSANDRAQKLSASRSAGHVGNSASHGSSNSNSSGNTHSHSNSSSSAGSGGSSGSNNNSNPNSNNHLHLSGRRGRRYFDDHKQGITA
ncbi:hypothetical protein F5144DRAFT_144484 [Chaetomium tenue]|uniref:Uncharacterized protein n=1 Tax=Chaetomium tenue TaxID=1854479 RepID=A0ACB7PIA4_9PEZI|nr:hypothetical protein F5144DRAFT_144484 [Chaetomium globosum]